MCHAVETLEPRSLCASISGTIWNDVDRSQTFDAGESPLQKWHAFIDANANGRFDVTEAVATTTKGGAYVFNGLKSGSYLVGVVPPAGFGQTSPGPNASAQSQFTIDLKFNGTFSADARAAFAIAARRWEMVLQGIVSRGDLRVASVSIVASLEDVDGKGGTLASSGPSNFRSANGLPSAGNMTFDSADIAQLKTDNQLISTITHEMAHVLGFGTLWDTFSLLRGEGTSSVRYIGAAAVKEYDSLFKTTATSVPVESGGGDGTADSHWSESVLNEEMLTGFVESAGRFQPLSRITVAQFKDLGYQVNLNAADFWNPLAHTSSPTTALTIGGKPFEKLVTIANDSDMAGIDFGYRADTAPVIQIFTASPSPAPAGTNITLSVGSIADAERDPITGVTFFRESNGRRGLQTGRGGDTYIATKFLPRSRRWRVETATNGLIGAQQYYAVAIDDLGLAGKASINVNVTASASVRGAFASTSHLKIALITDLLDSTDVIA